MKHRKNVSHIEKLYPEVRAGGFSRVDGSVEFYLRVNALLGKDMQVLDIGAGRGAQLERKEAPFRTGLARIKGKVRKLIGVDVDEAVLQNPFLDEAHVIKIGEPMPFSDATFDVIYADWVLEHVDNPLEFSTELLRLLKPGGWFCARTPNRWGMTGIATNLIPNRFHTKALHSLQPTRQDRDVFPTVYKMNTKRVVKGYFPQNSWENYTYLHNPEPPYVQKSAILFVAALLYFRLAPSFLATNLHIFLRKK